MKLINFMQRFILLLVIWTQSADVFADEKQLAVFVDNTYPPYMYASSEGNSEGLYPRLLNEIIKGTSYSAEIRAVPWKRALLFGETGAGAVGGAYKNNKRLEIYDYSVPIYQERMVVFANKTNQFEFSQLNDLAGKTIGVNRGWSYGQKFDAAREAGLFHVNERADTIENFKLLALGRIDCVVIDKLSGESYLQLLGLSEKIVSLPVPFTINDSYLIISKKLEMSEFLNEFASSLDAMRKNGQYDTIIQDYIFGKTSALK